MDESITYQTSNCLIKLTYHVKIKNIFYYTLINFKILNIAIKANHTYHVANILWFLHPLCSMYFKFLLKILVFTLMYMYIKDMLSKLKS